jgi:2'-5' RNA ligase
MQKKINITIELPDEVKNLLRKEESRWKNLRVFWTGFSQIHLTLEYLGVVDKDGLKQIKDALAETVEETKAFNIRLDRIVLGPNEKEPTMFWVTIYEDGAVRDFRKRLRDHLWDQGFELKVTDFVPHIVMAKANGNQLKGKQTCVHLKGRVPVTEINLFSSQTYAKGATKYKLVESYPLSK